jgi:hypothetical protein
MKFFNTLFVLFGLITYSHADTVFLGKIQQKSAVNQNTDKKYNYYVLNLSNKTTSKAINNEGDLESINNVKAIQLNFMDSKFKVVTNRKSKVVCKNLYTPDSMYHHENVICTVKSLKYLQYYSTLNSL